MLRGRRPLRVLIVEDEALAAMLLRTHLEDAGHEVTGWATTQDEALRQFEALRPDLAFVDVHLADGPTGVTVAQRIQCAGIHVVFVTANDRMLPDDYAGAIGCIGKPYSVHGIQRALEYLEEVVRDSSPQCSCPPSLKLAPQYERRS